MIYQEEQEIQEKQPENASFATIAQVYEDGVTLLFGKEDAPSQKRYRVNSFAVFHAGDRVFLAKDSGTYVVLFPIGTPKASFRADTAAQADTANTAGTAAKANSAVYATNAANAKTAMRRMMLPLCFFFLITFKATASKPDRRAVLSPPIDAGV